MTRTQLAIIFGVLSASIGAGLAAFIGVADPSLQSTVIVLSVITPINAGLSAAAAFLTGTDKGE